MDKLCYITLQDFILYATSATELIPVILYLSRKDKINKELRVIFYLQVIGFVFDALHTYFNLSTTALFVTNNLFTPIETVLLSIYFVNLLNSQAYKKIIASIASIVCLIWVILFVQKGTTSYIDLAVNIEAIYIIALSVLFFFYEINKPESLFLYQQSKFWVVVSYLLYSSGTFFLFLYIYSLDSETQSKYYILNSIFVVIKSILLSIAMCMKDSPVKPKKFQLT